MDSPICRITREFSMFFCKDILYSEQYNVGRKKLCRTNISLKVLCSFVVKGCRFGHSEYCTLESQITLDNVSVLYQGVSVPPSIVP